MPRFTAKEYAMSLLLTVVALACIIRLGFIGHRLPTSTECKATAYAQRQKIDSEWQLAVKHTSYEWPANISKPSPIPRILHYVFRDQMAFESYKQTIRSCLQLNPDWRVLLWRDADSLKLVHEHFQYFENKFLGYKDRLEKSDSVRYMILHKFGGIYLDMDVTCLRPFDQLISGHPGSGVPAPHPVSAFLGEERREQTRILYGYSSCTMNSLMGSAPGHPFFQFVINRMLAVPELNHARLSTGPDFLTRSYVSWSNCSDCQQAGKHVSVFPARLVSPLMDTSLVNWESKCSPYFKVKAQGSSKEDSSKLEEETWRRLGCAELVAKAWSFDDTDNTTVAVHRFTHQGYGNQGGRQTFDLLKEFPRVKTYWS